MTTKDLANILLAAAFLLLGIVLALVMVELRNRLKRQHESSGHTQMQSAREATPTLIPTFALPLREVSPNGFASLTNRERDIAYLASQGNSNKDIATHMHISPNTVSNHLSNIYTKLGLRSRAELAPYALYLARDSISPPDVDE